MTRRQLLGGALGVGLGAGASEALAAPAQFPAGLQTPVGQAGGSLRVGVKVDVQDFYPPRMGSFATWQAAANIYRSLYAMGDGTPNEPDPLVEDVDISDDFLTWQFKITPGIEYHDGTELTAEDFAHSINQLRDPDTGSYLTFWYARVTSVEATDTHTLLITCSEPNALLDLVLVPITGAPYRPELDESLATTPIGVGPYMFGEHVPQTSTTLLKNPNYYVSGLPLLDEITYQVIPEESSKVAALLAGDVDWIDSVPLQNMEELSNDPNISLVQTSSTWIDYYMLACDREPFSDQRVRNALEHAMDRTTLAQGVSLGLYQPWFSQVAEASPLQLQNTGIEHDLDRAKALMSEAGYADGFSMNIVPLPQYPEMIRAAEILKEQWAAINVEVEVRVEDPGVVGDIFTNREWDCWYSGTTQGYDPHEKLYAYYHSGEGTYNFQRWSDPRVDELLDSALATRDAGQRTELYTEANQMIIESSSRVATYQRITAMAMRPSVLNYQIRHDSIPFWDAVSLET
jgi:peptide/nickel transport system substrate-binding protein